MASSTTEVVVVPVAGRKTPKMKADARRVLLIHSLSTKRDHNKPTPGPEFLRERAALRRRTLRTFFCCRSFCTAFFTSSDKQKERTHSKLFLTNNDGDDTLRLASASSRPRNWDLKSENAHFGTLMRLLQVGQAEMQGFGLSICSFDRPTFTTIRRWAEVFAVLRNLSALDGISVNAMRMHTSPCVAHMLREFLGPKMADVSLFPSPDFLALAPCFGSTALRQVRTYYISERQPYIVPFFRVRARELHLYQWTDEVAAHGPLERNEAVEKVVVTLDYFLSFPSFRKRPGSEFGGLEPNAEKTRELRTAFKNLRALNDRLVLQVFYSRMQLAEIADSMADFEASMFALISRVREVVECAQEAGFPDVQLWVPLALPHFKQEAEAYHRVLTTASRFFAAQQNSTRSPAHAGSPLKDVSLWCFQKVVEVWTTAFEAANVHFVFVGH